MLKAIKEMLVGTKETPVKPMARVATPQSPAGYFMPATAEQLLDTASRKQCLQQLWENSVLPKDLYTDFYLQPLKQLMALMQVLPAAQQGEYAREGGLAEVTLQTVTYAVRLAKGHMLPPGAAPEEQAAQNVQWNMVVFYAALWHYLPLLSQLEGELRSGQPWLVGVAIPKEPYRFRFAATPLVPALAASQSTMIAVRLLPAALTDWLSALPAAIRSLMLIASRQPSALPVIDDIVREAARRARGEDLLAALQSGPVVVTPAVPLTPIVPATEKEILSPPMPSIDLQSAVSSPSIVEPVGEDELNLPGAAPASVTEVLLSSALDSPVNDKPLAEMEIAPEPVVGTGEGIRALLSLMAVGVSAPVNQTEQAFGDAPHEDEGPMPADNPVLTAEATQEVDAVKVNLESDGGDDIASEVAFSTPELGIAQSPSQSLKPAIEGDGGATSGEGEAFWRWLADGLNSNQILTNTVEARVHLVSGFVFITVPGIFYLYLKQAGLDGSQREALQEDFERLEKHRRGKGKRFHFAHLYETSECTGAFKRTKGYLIKASLLYRGKKLPDDSPVLVIP
ncbi:TraI domain-containing protein [Serratia sp. CY85251]|uniref:TraI domain-containing protein n=1 Tax=Serratia sp. CY85251 TaxID=3383696 RepID=UPI003FA0186B